MTAVDDGTLVLDAPRAEAVFALAPSLDAAMAEGLCRALNERMHGGGALILDGSAVERVSTLCVQVLVGSARSARARDLPFALRAPSPALAAALAQLGLQREVAGRDA